MNKTLYIKFDKNVRIHQTPIHLKDLGIIHCEDKTLQNKVRCLTLSSPNISQPGRYVVSIVDCIQVIEKHCPGVEISNLGESDFIITAEKKQTSSAFWSLSKTALVCLLSFFGAAFSIMAFNNDVGITTLFHQFYFMYSGEKSNGFTILEISYSIGVALGILVFFHHFARKKGQSDPTPLEVEMRSYEDKIDIATIEAADRIPGNEVSGL